MVKILFLFIFWTFSHDKHKNKGIKFYFSIENVRNLASIIFHDYFNFKFSKIHEFMKPEYCEYDSNIKDSQLHSTSNQRPETEFFLLLKTRSEFCSTVEIRDTNLTPYLRLLYHTHTPA